MRAVVHTDKGLAMYQVLQISASLGKIVSGPLLQGLTLLLHVQQTSIKNVQCHRPICDWRAQLKVMLHCS